MLGTELMQLITRGVNSLAVVGLKIGATSAVKEDMFDSYVHIQLSQNLLGFASLASYVSSMLSLQ